MDTYCIQDLPRLAVVALSKGPGGKMHSWHHHHSDNCDGHFHGNALLLTLPLPLRAMVMAMAMVMVIIVYDEEKNHAAMDVMCGVARSGGGLARGRTRQGVPGTSHL